jgi:hypothetical protein
MRVFRARYPRWHRWRLPSFPPLAKGGQGGWAGIQAVRRYPAEPSQGPRVRWSVDFTFPPLGKGGQGGWAGIKAVCGDPAEPSLGWAGYSQVPCVRRGASSRWLPILCEPPRSRSQRLVDRCPPPRPPLCKGGKVARARGCLRAPIKRLVDRCPPPPAPPPRGGERGRRS